MVIDLRNKECVPESHNSRPTASFAQHDSDEVLQCPGGNYAIFQQFWLSTIQGSWTLSCNKAALCTTNGDKRLHGIVNHKPLHRTILFCDEIQDCHSALFHFRSRTNGCIYDSSTMAMQLQKWVVDSNTWIAK
jgi:hypothetical protein